MSGNWQTITTPYPSVELEGLKAGSYEMQVTAIGATGLTSSVSKTTFNVTPQLTIPTAPQNVSISPIDQYTGLLTWDQTSDIQVIYGGSVLIYHSPVLTGATWDESTVIISSVAGKQSSAVVPLLAGTYLVKFRTSSGTNSNDFGSTVITLSEPDPLLTIATIQEETGSFAGTKSALIYDAIKGGLVLSVGALFDTLDKIDNLPLIDLLGGVTPTGQYEFSSIIDVGGICDVNLTRRLKVGPYNIATTFDENIANLDTWGDFDCIDVTDANAFLYVRATDDNPTVLIFDSILANIDTWTDFDYGFASWSEWRICTNNLLRGRAFQFKMIAMSEQANQNIVIKELGVVAKLRQRIEVSSSTITSGAAMYQVNFANNFHVAPAVAITPTQTYTGDYYVIGSITNSGFQVTFYDSGANIVSRNFNYTAVGYGRRF